MSAFLSQTEKIFESVINMSLTGSVVILVVILARIFLQKLPKKYSYFLWSIAAFRLCCPFSIKSIFSIFNINPIQEPSEIVTSSGTMNYIGASAIHSSVQAVGGNAVNTATNAPSSTFAATTLWNNIEPLLPFVWLIGVAALVIYCITDFVIIKKRLSNATKMKDNIYQSDYVFSPFILGIAKPKIYIPYGLEGDSLDYVITHEKYHLKRGDNIAKLFAFFVLCVHWFNPLCWIAFCLMNKDMEMSCDEKVVSGSGDIKKAYSSTILSFATDRRKQGMTPLCFSENNIKSRINNVLKFKKPGVIISAVAIILCIGVGVTCILNPVTKAKEPSASVKNETTLPEPDITFSDANPIGANEYSAWSVLASNPLMSRIVYCGAETYPKIVINDNDIEISYNDYSEKTTIKGTLSATRKIKVPEDINGYKYGKRTMHFLEDELKDMLRGRENVSEKQFSSENRVFVATVYFENGKPFAFCDMSEIYELTPNTENLEPLISKSLLEINSDEKFIQSNVDFRVESHDTLMVKKGDLDGKNKDSCITAFLHVYYGALMYQSGMLEEKAGNYVPCAITFDIVDNKYAFSSYYEPRDGSYYNDDLKKYFPKNALTIINYNNYLAGKYGNNTHLTELTQKAYAGAIPYTDFHNDIPAMFDSLTKEIPIDKNNVPETYFTLLNYGDYTMRYIYSEFLKGGQTGAKGNAMKEVMCELLGDSIIKYAAKNGQDYFDELLKHEQKILKGAEQPEDYKECLRQDEKYVYMLLQMSGDITEKETLDYLKEKLSAIEFDYRQPELYSVEDVICSETGAVYLGDIGSGRYIKNFSYGKVEFCVAYPPLEEIVFTCDGKTIDTLKINTNTSAK